MKRHALFFVIFFFGMQMPLQAQAGSGFCGICNCITTTKSTNQIIYANNGGTRTEVDYRGYSENLRNVYSSFCKTNDLSKTETSASEEGTGIAEPMDVYKSTIETVTSCSMTKMLEQKYCDPFFMMKGRTCSCKAKVRSSEDGTWRTVATFSQTMPDYQIGTNWHLSSCTDLNSARFLNNKITFTGKQEADFIARYGVSPNSSFWSEGQITCQ
jgi:hypothetical protein